MKKKAAQKKAPAKKTSAPRAAKAVASKPASRAAAKSVKTAKSAPAKAVKLTKLAPSKPAAAPVLPGDEGKLTFNHAMIYAKDVARSMAFYRDLMGFKLIEDFRYEGIPVYARLRAPGGDGTIACIKPGRALRLPAKEYAYTSRSAISTTSAASSREKVSTSLSCHG
jgi:hypothetical protein